MVRRRDEEDVPSPCRLRTGQHLPRPNNGGLLRDYTMLTSTLEKAPSESNMDYLPMWLTFEPIPETVMTRREEVVSMDSLKPLRCPYCNAFASNYFDIRIRDNQQRSVSDTPDEDSSCSSSSSPTLSRAGESPTDEAGHYGETKLREAGYEPNRRNRDKDAKKERKKPFDLRCKQQRESLEHTDGEFDYTCGFCFGTFYVLDPDHTYSNLWQENEIEKYQCLEYELSNRGGTAKPESAPSTGPVKPEETGNPPAACLVVDISVLDRVLDFLENGFLVHELIKRKGDSTTTSRSGSPVRTQLKPTRGGGLINSVGTAITGGGTDERTAAEVGPDVDDYIRHEKREVVSPDIILMVYDHRNLYLVTKSGNTTTGSDLITSKPTSISVVPVNEAFCPLMGAVRDSCCISLRSLVEDTHSIIEHFLFRKGRTASMNSGDPASSVATSDTNDVAGVSAHHGSNTGIFGNSGCVKKVDERLKSLSILEMAKDMLTEVGGGHVMWVNNRSFDFDEALESSSSTFQTLTGSSLTATEIRKSRTQKYIEEWLRDSVSLDVCDLSSSSILGVQQNKSSSSGSTAKNIGSSAVKSLLKSTPFSSPGKTAKIITDEDLYRGQRADWICNLRAWCEETGGRYIHEVDSNHFGSEFGIEDANGMPPSSVSLFQKNRHRWSNVDGYTPCKATTLQSPIKNEDHQMPLMKTALKQACLPQKSFSNIDVNDLYTDNGKPQDEYGYWGNATDTGRTTTDFEQGALITDGKSFSFGRGCILLDPFFNSEFVRDIARGRAEREVPLLNRVSRGESSCDDFIVALKSRSNMRHKYAFPTYNQHLDEKASEIFNDGVDCEEPEEAARFYFNQMATNELNHYYVPSEYDAVDAKGYPVNLQKIRQARRSMQILLTLKYSLNTFFTDLMQGFSKVVVKFRVSRNYALAESIGASLEEGTEIGPKSMSAAVDIFEAPKVAANSTFSFRVMPKKQTRFDSFETNLLVNKEDPLSIGKYYRDDNSVLMGLAYDDTTTLESTNTNGESDVMRPPGLVDTVNAPADNEGYHFLNGGKIAIFPFMKNNRRRQSSISTDSITEEVLGSGRRDSSLSIRIDESYPRSPTRDFHEDQLEMLSRYCNVQLQIIYRENATGKTKLRVCSAAFESCAGMRSLYENCNVWKLANMLLKIPDSHKIREQMDTDVAKFIKQPDNGCRDGLGDGVAIDSVTNSSVYPIESIRCDPDLSARLEEERKNGSHVLGPNAFIQQTPVTTPAKTPRKSSKATDNSMFAKCPFLLEEQFRNPNNLGFNRYDSEVMSEACMAWMRLYHKVANTMWRRNAPSSLCVPQSLKFLPLLSMCAKKKVNVDSLVPLRRMAVSQSAYWIYPRCFVPCGTGSALSARSLLSASDGGLCVLFDGQRMFILLDKILLESDIDWDGTDQTAVYFRRVREILAKETENHQRKLADPVCVPDRQRKAISIPGGSRYLTSANSNLGTPEVSIPVLSKLEEIFRRYLKFAKTLEKCEDEEEDKDYPTTALPGITPRNSGPPSKSSEPSSSSGYTTTEETYASSGYSTNPGYRGVNSEASTRESSRRGSKEAFISKMDPLRTEHPTVNGLYSGENFDKCSEKPNDFFDTLDGEAFLRNSKRPHSETEILSVEECLRLRDLALLIGMFLREAQREMPFYACEILFLDKATLKEVLDKDSFGIKSHFLLEDETFQDPGYDEFIGCLYDKLSTRSSHNAYG